MMRWQWPATMAEIIATLHAQGFLNYHRGKNDQPIRLPFPFPDPDAVTPEERAALEQQLQRRSAFAR